MTEQAVPTISLRALDGGQRRALLPAVLATLKRDDVPTLAAGAAFKIFLALFPAMFAAVAIFTLATSGSDVLRLLAELEFLPSLLRDELAGPLERFVEQAGGAELSVAIIGIVAGLWAVSSAAVTLMKALSRINDLEETRGFLAMRLGALAITLALLIALVTIGALLVAGGAVQQAVLDAVMGAQAPGRDTAGLLATVARYGVSIVVLIVVLAFVFWIGPDRREHRPPFQWLTPGAAVGVLGWLVASAVFGLYVRIAGVNPVYGALGGVIVLMLWLQLTMLVLLLGAELNAEIRRARAGMPHRHGKPADQPAAVAAAVPPADARATAGADAGPTGAAAGADAGPTPTGAEVGGAGVPSAGAGAEEGRSRWSAALAGAGLALAAGALGWWRNRD
ncbi:MAG: YihY/virulence factor BrkB family protein [Egibacteraceae bacterium]